MPTDGVIRHVPGFDPRSRGYKYKRPKTLDSRLLMSRMTDKNKGNRKDAGSPIKTVEDDREKTAKQIGAFPDQVVDDGKRRRPKARTKGKDAGFVPAVVSGDPVHIVGNDGWRK
ncbi:MAG: hypothetical protein OXB94_05230, partial [Nitrospira sp.]|nr:hypothetical protein [Nitrospira sp.]